MRTFLETTMATPGKTPQNHEIAVDVTEFRRLIISHRRLERADQPGRRGLRDVETGHVYWLDERSLRTLR